MSINLITEKIITAAITVHRELGPGLLESAYEKCLGFEFTDCGLSFEQQVSLPLKYKTHVIPNAYRVDFLVERQVIVEVKAIEKLPEIVTAQVLTYQRLTRCRIGLILNFKVPILIHGIRRLIIDLPDSSVDSVSLW